MVPVQATGKERENTDTDEETWSKGPSCQCSVLGILAMRKITLIYGARMSLLRAFRRGCNTEFGSVLRCFDIPSRRNAVEPFVVGGGEEEDGEKETEEHSRLYRTAIPEESTTPQNLVRSIDPSDQSARPYHNIWCCEDVSKETTITTPASIELCTAGTPITTNFLKLPAIQGTPPRMFHPRLHNFLETSSDTTTVLPKLLQT